MQEDTEKERGTVRDNSKTKRQRDIDRKTEI